MRTPNTVQGQALRTFMLAAIASAALSACGGGSADSAAPAASSAAASSPAADPATGGSATTLSAPELDAEALASSAADPTYQTSPAFVDEPSDIDAANPAASAALPPTRTPIAAELAEMDPKSLNADTMRVVRARAQRSGSSASAEAAGNISTFTPAQIRSAYGMAPLPAAGTTPTPAQLAALGAGQTIYIVDAFHDANAAAELAAFNAKFGLPTCAPKAIAPTAKLPLPPASATGCEFSVVYSTSLGKMSATAPAYSSQWGLELALDVQWAHATAPYARIVLIEAPTSYSNELLGAIMLANAMGPGVASMSWGLNDPGWASTVDYYFSGAGMTYVASAGDTGGAVLWPSVSSKVLSVGGTLLAHNGSGSRSESAWSASGGAVSAHTATPDYQSNRVPGMGAPAHRTTSDVSFNASPASGQYTAVMAPRSTAPSWIGMGGTSIAAPQWAGLLAAANAQRAAKSMAPIGQPHAALYQSISEIPGAYASAFYDVASGGNGKFAARSGYDAPTGLGTPNAQGLMAALSGSTAPVAPAVTAATFSGTAWQAMAFTPASTDPAGDALSYSISGAPAGMDIDAATGLAAWPVPLPGSYLVVVTAKDVATGLSGSATITVSVALPPAPTLVASSISGKAGVALAFTARASSSSKDPLIFSLTGAPPGMAINAATGAVSWASPTAGSYHVTIVATDSKSGLSGRAVFTVTVSAVAPALPPIVEAASANATVGKPFSLALSVVSTHSASLSLSGNVPSGLSLSSAGVLSWSSPVAGNYFFTVKAVDSVTGLSGSAAVTLRVKAPGPTLLAEKFTGKAGVAFTGSIPFGDSSSKVVQLIMRNFPVHMTFTLSGSNLVMHWAAPVAGTYLVQVTVVDATLAQTTAVITVTIS